MPELSDITYSGDATVAAFCDYYQFLTKMYLKESDPIEPPKGGWPMITPTVLAGLEKDEKVIDLLRHLPYMRCSCDESSDAAPWAKMMDWQHVCDIISAGKHDTSAEVYKFLAEGEYQDKIPSTVVGLLDTGPDVECFFLDTDQGTIYWPECHIQYAIPNFFELLKNQFRDLQFIPISTEKVILNYERARAGEEGMLPMLQAIYREHGWPDLDSYRKEECLKAVQKALVKHFLDCVDY
ncbi:hypothetical protein DL98DRAFT_624756 [Cadophora sp. DSE1049]|nr:hypothetical protein DL98DRAFT_624756 [Cadophora sp. DSE1049]